MTGPIAEFLVESRKAGADFSHTLTLGHQTLFVSPRRLRRLLRENGLWPEGISAHDFYAEFTESPGYIDPFLQAIGADEVHAMDASPYEGADVVQDLNTPVPEQFKERYTVVFDGGTLEHIFNFPTALKNCMEMLRPGGTLFVNVIANQQFGHGFYQVSPEFFFRALAPENGFTVERMHAYEGVMGASSALGLPYEFQWMGPRYRVEDPMLHGGRHELFNRWPLALMVEARKLETVPVFRESPQQSDYQATWTSHAGEAIPEPSGDSLPWASRLQRRVAGSLRADVKTALWLDVLPRLLRPLDPLRYRRARTRASLSNDAMYVPVARSRRSRRLRRKAPPG
jgi:hypothetical protein